MEKKQKPQFSARLPRQSPSVAQPISAEVNAAPPSAKKLAELWYDLRQSEHDLSQHATPVPAINQSIVALHQAAPPPSVFLGILGRCAITGCDVHFLTKNGDIINHLAENDATPSGFEKARAMIYNLPPGELLYLFIRMR